MNVNSIKYGVVIYIKLLKLELRYYGGRMFKDDNFYIRYLIYMLYSI